MMIRFFLLLLVFALPAYAQEATPDIPLADPASEAQAKSLFYELRCEVCEGQTIADSNAALAADMRALVRQQISDGKSATEIRLYFADRYGDAILMRPPVDARTAPLWLAPAFGLLLGGLYIFTYFRRKSHA